MFNRANFNKLLHFFIVTGYAFTASGAQLQGLQILQRSPGIDRFDVNTRRGPSFQPNTPIVHTYHGVGALVPLVVALPEGFAKNLPGPIISILKKYPRANVDIFFTPQEEVRDFDASLKPAYWMFPNRPALDKIVGSPPEYTRSVEMMIIESDQNIDDQVVSNALRSFQVILHDERVSPDTGHLAIGRAQAGSFAFYSVVVFDNRIAVTLHWILSKADREALVQMTRFALDSGLNNLADLLDFMKSDGSPFKGKPMLQKLEALLRPF